MVEALRLLSPSSTGTGEQTKSDVRFLASSKARLQELIQQAEEVEFTEDSAEAKFVKEKVDSLTRQVVGLATKTKVQDDQDQDSARIRLALALIHHLKKALTSRKVVNDRQAEKPRRTRRRTAPAPRPTGTNRPTG